MVDTRQCVGEGSFEYFGGVRNAQTSRGLRAQLETQKGQTDQSRIFGAH